MAITVREVMNRELFTLRPSERVDDAVRFLVGLGVSGAPVADECVPIGVVSLKDLLDVRLRGDTVGERMRSPVVSIDEDLHVDAAARVLAEHGVHRLIVVDAAGRGIGIVSAVDLLRGLLGVPAVHPPAFPHLDPRTGLSWTDDAPLDAVHVDRSPRGPGLVVLVRGAAGVRERVIWAESTDDIRGRLRAMIAPTEHESITLRQLLLRPETVRFRVAPSTSTAEQRRALRRVLAAAYHDDLAARG
jgi:CBS domain-containing protein